MKQLLKIALIVCACVAFAGCATSRSSLKVAIPPSSVANKPATGQLVFIESVSDQRVFEENPSDPSVPSLKKGENYSLDAEGRKKAIARKRNTYGMALGDIMLDGNDTVETLARQLVAQGFERRGYRVVNAADSSADLVRVKIAIKQFWAWFTPGFFSVDMEAKINTLIDVAGAGQTKSLDVAAYGKNSGQSGRDDNWREAYDRAFNDYSIKLDAALGGTLASPHAAR